eukprot:4293323-Amphidinium_carterae.3
MSVSSTPEPVKELLGELEDTWIPSSSNPADGPSRGDFFGLLKSHKCHLDNEMVRHIMKVSFVCRGRDSVSVLF